MRIPDNILTSALGNLFGGSKARSTQIANITPNLDTYKRRLNQYLVMQAAYDGSIFRDTTRWSAYLKDRDLHEKTTCLINPVQRLSDFYASHLYPGGKTSPSFPNTSIVPLLIPIVGAEDNVKEALKQIWEWSNWQRNMALWIRQTSYLGDGILEVVDDVAAGRVYIEIVRPEFIPKVAVDKVGNIVYYEKEVPRIWDEKTKSEYTYGRRVTPSKIETFKDGNPHGFDGNPAVYDNPYGFIPMVWCKHRDPGVGLFPGLPAVRDWGKIEEYNSDLTRLRMFLRKQGLTPQLLTGMGEIMPYLTEEDGSVFDIEDMLILTAKEQGVVHKLEGNLNVDNALKALMVTSKEIENDHPELKAHEEFKNMSQTTGPAAQQILGSIGKMISMVSSNYDEATIEIHRMALAIAGQRAKEKQEGWANPTEKQKKFSSFSLDSVNKNSLDFGIAPRDVAVLSEYDVAETRRTKFISYSAGVRAGMPLSWQLLQDGFEQDDIDKIMVLREKEFKEQLRWAAEMQEASAGITVQPTIGKDSQIANIPTGSGKAGGQVKTNAERKAVANPGSQTTEANSEAKSITSQQTN